MKSGGQMSSQSPVVWWYREMNCEVVGMFLRAMLIVTFVATQILWLKNNTFFLLPVIERTVLLTKSRTGSG
jgi:hypothetical protein